MKKNGCSDVTNFKIATAQRSPSANTSTADSELPESLAPLANQSRSNLAQVAAMKRYLSVKQVVETLNGAVSVKLIYKLIAQRKLRVNRATGKVLVEEESLIELMQGKPTTPVPELPPPRQRPRGRPRKNEAELW